MTSRLLTAAFALALAAGTVNAHAGDRQDDRERQFAEGVAAYDAADYAAALRIWEPLADDGDLAAMRNVAQLYRNGLGVRQDFRKARRYFARAAEMGLPAAMVNLGVMLLEGQGTGPDAEDAGEWFYRAARAGDANGQYFLAQLLEQGRGMGQDIEAARAYYAAAARRGHALAEEALGRLGGPPPDAPDAIWLDPEGVAPKTEKLAENDFAAPKLPRKDPRRLYGGTGLLRKPGSLEEVER